MATTIYRFKPHESLSLIAKRYHTDVKTLTTLNSWLINPHTKKTEMFPAKIKYVYKQTNSVTQNIALEMPAKKGSVKIYAYANTVPSGKCSIWADDKLGHIKTDNGAGNIVYNINYTNRKLTAINLLTLSINYKLLEIEYEADLAKDFLVVPLIGNGNTSIEDYWENVDKVTGISLNRLMTSLANDDKHLLDISSVYAQTDNGSITSATLEMVNNGLLDVDTNGGEYLDSTSENSNAGLITNAGNQAGLYENTDWVTDFTTARVGGIVQTVINEGSKNMRDYFLYNFDHSNNGPYGASSNPYTSDATFGTTGSIKQAIDSATADGYTAALYGNKKTNFYSYSNGLYGDLSTDVDANKAITAQNQRWSRDNLSLYKYDTIGIKRDNSILQAVEVIIGNTLIYMPCWPESVQDGAQAEYDQPPVLGRSSPYVIYTRTGERSIDFTFKLHREMLDSSVAVLTEDIIKNPDKVATRSNEIEQIIRLVESAVYPNYDGTVAAVRTQVKIGNTLYISGVMTSQSSNWYGPIGPDHKYNQCDISFTVLEVTDNPKSHNDIKQIGGWRTS